MIDTKQVCSRCNGTGSAQSVLWRTIQYLCPMCTGKGNVRATIDEYLDGLYRFEKLNLACDLIANLKQYGQETEVEDLTEMDTRELHETIKRLDSMVDSARKTWDENNGVIR